VTLCTLASSHVYLAAKNRGGCGLKGDLAKEVPNNQWMRIWLIPRRLLIAAAIFHLVLTATICALGHHRVLPSMIDSNGILVALASDGAKYQAEANQLSDELTRGQISDWLNTSSPFHVKLHSIFFATFGPLFGSTVLKAEPLNVLCYLATLTLVFHLSKEIFNRRAGFLAAAVVALWPSFLLHTTQPLRDPLFVAGMLAFIFVNVRLLSRDFSWGSALLTALSGGLAAALVWLSRDTMREVLIATTWLAGALLLIKQFAKKDFHAERGSPGWRAGAPTLVGMALLIVLSVGVTQILPKFRRTYKSDPANSKSQDEIWQNSRGKMRDTFIEQQSTSGNPGSRFVARVGKLRRGFVVEFSDAGSNIDGDVQIESTGDFLRYLPRAAMIGFFAPFPKMWFVTGDKVSWSGRLLSGVEMLAIYLVEVLAIFGLWNGRRRLAVWFLWLVAAMAMIALGLVVINIGALYRLRYVFVILLIILASERATFTFEWLGRKRLSRGMI
jgi:Dolichyl-phosphate-mannose-protein mannosyltransferase